MLIQTFFGIKMINFSSEEKREGVRSNKWSHVLWFPCNLRFKPDDLEAEFIGEMLKCIQGRSYSCIATLGVMLRLCSSESAGVESKCLQDGFPHLSWTTSGKMNIRIDFQISIKPETPSPECLKSSFPSLLGSYDANHAATGQGEAFSWIEIEQESPQARAFLLLTKLRGISCKVVHVSVKPQWLQLELMKMRQGTCFY